MTMAICFYVLILVASITIKNNRISDFILIFLLTILMGFNTSNADFIQYEWKYNYSYLGIDQHGELPGYRLLEFIGHCLKLDFIGFRLLLGFLSLILLYSWLVKYCVRPRTALTLYSIFPFFYDVTQFRFFVAASICIWATRFLIDEPKHGRLKFCLFVLGAATIHQSTLLYLFLSLYKIKRTNLYKIISVLFVLILCGIYTGFATSFAELVLDSESVNAYFTEGVGFGWIAYLLCPLLFVIFAVLLLNSVQLNVNNIELRVNSHVMLNLDVLNNFANIFICSLLIAAFLPIMPMDFYRPIRSFCPLMYTYLVNFLNIKNLEKSSRSVLILFTCVWFTILLTVSYFSSFDFQVFERVVLPVFECNLLFN